MKIVIAGAHAVGTHLAKLLAKDNMDVVLVDADAARIGELTFTNMMTLTGSPTSIHVLREAGVPHCDLFIAVTPIESENIHACILAANLGARKTLARIDSFEMQKAESADFYKRIGISRLVYPEMLGGEAIASAIRRPWARHCYDLCNGSLLLLGVKVREGAPIVGQRLMEIGKKHHDSFHIAAIMRGDETIIPMGEDKVLAGDLVYFITLPEKENVVRFTCGKKERELRRVIILGGNRLGVQTCYYLPRQLEVVFIEDNPQMANYVMDKVPQAKVVRGVTSHVETLRELVITEHDAFVALSQNADSNILACLTAKKLGVGKTVADVADIEQITMAQNLNIGSTVNRKLLTASAIYQMLLDADKTNAKCYSLVDAEVADIVAQPGSKITQRQICDLSLPRDITLGGLVRHGVGMTVTGQTRIEPGDHVIVICRDERIRAVEKLFT